MVVGLTQQLTIEFIALRTLGHIERPTEQRLSLSVFQIGNTTVGNKAARVLHTVPFQGHRDVRMTVIGIEHVDECGVLLTLTVHHDTLQVDLSLIDVVMQHHQGEEVVGRTAEVGVENHLNRSRFVSNGLHCHLLGSTGMGHDSYKEEHGPLVDSF